MSNSSNSFTSIIAKIGSGLRRAASSIFSSRSNSSKSNFSSSLDDSGSLTSTRSLGKPSPYYTRAGRENPYAPPPAKRCKIDPQSSETPAILAQESQGNITPNGNSLEESAAEQTQKAAPDLGLFGGAKSNSQRKPQQPQQSQQFSYAVTLDSPSLSQTAGYRNASSSPVVSWGQETVDAYRNTDPFYGTGGRVRVHSTDRVDVPEQPETPKTPTTPKNAIPPMAHGSAGITPTTSHASLTSEGSITDSTHSSLASTISNNNSTYLPRPPQTAAQEPQPQPLSKEARIKEQISKLTLSDNQLILGTETTPHEANSSHQANPTQPPQPPKLHDLSTHVKAQIEALIAEFCTISKTRKPIVPTSPEKLEQLQEKLLDVLEQHIKTVAFYQEKLNLTWSVDQHVAFKIAEFARQENSWQEKQKGKRSLKEYTANTAISFNPAHFPSGATYTVVEEFDDDQDIHEIFINNMFPKTGNPSSVIKREKNEINTEQDALKAKFLNDLGDRKALLTLYSQQSKRPIIRKPTENSLEAKLDDIVGKIKEALQINILETTKLSELATQLNSPNHNHRVLKEEFDTIVEMVEKRTNLLVMHMKLSDVVKEAKIADSRKNLQDVLIKMRDMPDLKIPDTLESIEFNADSNQGQEPARNGHSRGWNEDSGASSTIPSP